MVNLQYCSTAMAKKTRAILDDPCVHEFTKDIIRKGLFMDSLDAVKDTELALSILKEIERNYLR